MFPSVRLAQNILETGGKIHSYFNLGGIKVGSGKPNEWWDGSSINAKTWEVYNGVVVNTSANFRAYKSVYHFYKDQDLLFNISRYNRVRAAKTPEEQAAMLQACGYATDPAYPGKLIALINAHELRKYDDEVEVEEPMTKEEKAAFEQLQKQVETLKGLVEQKEPPAWAAGTVEKLQKKTGRNGLPILSDPKGDHSFFRTLVVLDRAGAFE